MRTLLIGVLAATQVGCSYSLSPQASMDACADPNGPGGLNKMVASRPIEPASPSSKASSATTRAKSATVAKTEERSTAAVREKPELAEKKAAATVIETKVEAPASGRPAETSDPVIVKAKTTIAAKLEDPASAEFIEMKRAIRKNMVGQSVDTICGRVKAKNTSDEHAGNRPFLYFVKNDAGFVVYGPAGSAAETAYRTICGEPVTTEPPPGSVATDRKVP